MCIIPYSHEYYTCMRCITMGLNAKGESKKQLWIRNR